jgi:hypothetical protein
MKICALLLGLAALVLSPACERIPPSVSIPGYGEKKAADQHSAGETLGTTTNPPTFFPPQGGH